MFYRWLILFLLVSYTANAKIDTLFMDKDWKVVKSRAQASFFRPLYPKENGRYRLVDYFISGQPQMTGYYNFPDASLMKIPLTDDKYKDGRFVHYFENGQLSSEGDWVNGLREGIRIEYSDSMDGSLWAIVKYENGKHQDTSRGFYSNRKIKWVQVYRMDTLLSHRKYDILGNLIENIEDDYRDGKCFRIERYYYAGTNKLRTETQYINNIQNGYDITYDSTGSKYVEYTFENGKKVGMSKAYYPNGKVKIMAEYKDNVWDGKYIIYDSLTNFEVLVGQNKLGQKQGVWKIYVPGTNKLFLTQQYEAGKLNGPYISYDPETRKPTLKGQYLNDKKTGKWIVYFAGTDNISATKEFSNDMQSGDFVSYDSATQKVSVEGHFKNNERTGTWKSYYNGTNKIWSLVNYDVDKYDRYTTYYDSADNHKISSGYYLDDKKIGKWMYFYKDGSLYGEMNYLKDKVGGEAVFYDSLTKKVKFKGTFVGEERQGVWQYFDPATGKLTSKETYKNGLLNGESISYNLSGKKVLERCFADGKLTGVAKRHYDSTDVLWYEASFKNGFFDGHVTTYFPSGKLKRSALYANGKFISGKCYSESGKEVPYYKFISEEVCTLNIDYYLKHSLVYPAEAIENKLEGEVQVRFDISTKGEISNIQVVKGIGGGCDEEAIRLITYMPPWLPQHIDGIPVNCTHIQSIVFRRD